MIAGLLICTLLAQHVETPRADPHLAGKFLVATRRSRDPDLAHSVILVIHSGPDGVAGLVINQPAPGTKPPTWFGGPIALGVRELFRSREAPRNAEHLFADVYLASIIDDRSGSRVYAGYSGWSVAQWQDEVARGLWKVVPASANLVFDAHPETLWRRLIR